MTSSISRKMMITETDAYQTILAWKESEQTRYHPRRESSKSSILLLNKNAETLTNWCRNVMDHFHLPLYLVEWTMNFVHRYAAAADGDNMNTTSTLKMMTAVALRLCIKLDAGQSIYSRHYARKSNHHKQHVVAMMTIPHLVARQEENKPASTTVIYCMNQMFVKLELVLMRSLGFYLYPPLTEHYIEEIHNIVEFMASKENIVADKLLEQIKTRAVFLAQSSYCWKARSNQTIQTQSVAGYFWSMIEKNDIFSTCNVAILSYLTALYIATYCNELSSSSLLLSQCFKNWYNRLMDTFVNTVMDVVGAASSSSPQNDKTKIQMLQDIIDVIILMFSSAEEDEYHDSFNKKNQIRQVMNVTPYSRCLLHHKKKKNVIIAVNNIANKQQCSSHHRNHTDTVVAAAAATLTTSPIITTLGKRKASPTSVCDHVSNGDDVALHNPMMKK